MAFKKTNNQLNFKPSKNINKKPLSCFIKLSFESNFNPSNLSNIRLLSSASSISKNGQFRLKRILLKQSYLMITWLQGLNHKNKVAISFMPAKKSLPLTKTKAPMAHKTHSQEQFTFKVYRYSSSRIPVQLKNTVAFAPDSSLSALLSLRGLDFGLGSSFAFVRNITKTLEVRTSKFLTL